MISASPSKRAMASMLLSAVSLLAAVRGSQAFTAVAQHRRPLCSSMGGRLIAQNNDNHNIIQMATNDLDFDFSSARGWESHYQGGGGGVDQQYDEWHATIDFDTIVKYCPPIKKTARNSHQAEEVRRTEEGIHARTVEEEQSFARFPISDEKEEEEENGATTTTTSSKTRVLMIGCGTSRLPEAFDANLYDCTLLDAAPTCIDTLRRRYGDETYSYIVGDALRLHRNHTGMGTFDYVVDKGLMDALLCGEGWSLWVRQLLDSVHNVLSSDDDDNNAGRYILVSYRLPTSTMAFLQNVAGSVLEWNFQVDGSNPRVMISIARRRRRHQQQPPPQQQHRWRALDQRQGEEKARSTTTGHHHHRRPAAWDMICNNYNNHEGQFNVDDNGSRRQRVTYDSYWDE
jgi:hypothetical protein